MKKIDTLVADIYNLVSKPRAFSEENVTDFAHKLAQVLKEKMSAEYTPRLRMSNLSTPCARKLWYSIRMPELAEAIPPWTKIKFIYGAILEEFMLLLAREAGHTVTGEQDQLDIKGVKGHRDAIIDGRLVDVKSASSFSFRKFASNGLRGADSFGYLGQLGAYLWGSRNDPKVADKDRVSFLAVDKTLGKICVDTYERDNTDYDALVDEKRAILASPTPPSRGFADTAEGAAGNRKLGTNCSYCDFKQTCWPGLRTFAYANGPVFLTTVKKRPQPHIQELINVRSGATGSGTSTDGPD